MACPSEPARQCQHFWRAIRPAGIGSDLGIRIGGQRFDGGPHRGNPAYSGLRACQYGAFFTRTRACRLGGDHADGGRYVHLAFGRGDAIDAPAAFGLDGVTAPCARHRPPPAGLGGTIQFIAVIASAPPRLNRNLRASL